jgi:thiosulfate dehydrogenase
MRAFPGRAFWGAALCCLTALAAWAGEAPAAWRKDAPVYQSRGGLGYLQFCAACHRLDGTGAPGVFSPLAGNPRALDEAPGFAIRRVLFGGFGARGNHVFRMPSFASLRDEEIAEILSFVRASWGGEGGPVTAAQVAAERQDAASPPPSATPRRFADFLASPQADLLLRGLREIYDTKRQLPGNVGAALNCASCHVNAGTSALAAPYWGLAGAFPIYYPRAGRVITLAQRVNDCFQRSLNGTPLAEESPEMAAIVAFISALPAPAATGEASGRGIRRIDRSLKPDPARGEVVFQRSCAVCHGANGDGLRNAAGERLFPPLWGEGSFNLGSGMARAYTAAGYVLGNMPVAHSLRFPQAQGGLTEQDALDVAAFFSHRPRPDFAGRAHDWPNGGRPPDARDEQVSAQVVFLAPLGLAAAAGADSPRP